MTEDSKFQDYQVILPCRTQEELISSVVEEMCSSEEYRLITHRPWREVEVPSLSKIGKMIDLLREILFPGYFGITESKRCTMSYYLGVALDQLWSLMIQQVRHGFCFQCERSNPDKCDECAEKSLQITAEFIGELPQLQRLLASDVRAAFEGDPAAGNYGEVIFCYPSLRAITHHRIAHKLYQLKVPVLPRIISEMAHTLTGIDIHPGARIGQCFFMDHGTGIVIGETAVIGSNVRIYQGVTLGAKSFPLDEFGRPVKGIIRHPTVEDDVTIYAGATILGKITIGKGSTVGGNVWLTRSVPPESRISQASTTSAPLFSNGGGI